MATVIASQLPDKQILMRHLKVEEPNFSRYLESFDSALLKNLNQFLGCTALKFIGMEDFSIILSTFAWSNHPNSNMLLRSCRMNLKSYAA
jgi:hypothetical protein